MRAELQRTVLEATSELLVTHSVGEPTINGIATEGRKSAAINRRRSNSREIALEAFRA